MLIADIFASVLDVVKLEDALKLLKKFNGEAVGYNKCRGIIGSQSLPNLSQ